MLALVSFMLAQMHAVALRFIQTPSFPPRFTQSHLDPRSLTQICSVSIRFLQSRTDLLSHAISPRPTQIHPISLRFALTHLDSCNPTQIRSASCSFTQIRSDSQNFNQIHSDSLHKLSLLGFVQIRSHLCRLDQFRSVSFAQIRSDSSRFTKIYSHLLRQATTAQS